MKSLMSVEPTQGMVNRHVQYIQLKLSNRDSVAINEQVLMLDRPLVLLSNLFSYYSIWSFILRDQPNIFKPAASL